MSGDLVVITSCTAAKLSTPVGTQMTAESLYVGQQHRRLMRGVENYRKAGQPAGSLRFRILSAFYGLLTPMAKVATYDHTFAGRPAAAIVREAHDKNVPQAIRDVLREPFAAGILLLGEPYVRACDLDEHIRLGGPLISFCSPKVARRMPRIPGLQTVPLTNVEARLFSVGLVALKGELAGRLLTKLAEAPVELEALLLPRTDILGWLASPPRTQVKAAA